MLRNVLELHVVEPTTKQMHTNVTESTATIACYAMSSVNLEDNNEINNTAALYELIPGVATSSNAFQCAIVSGSIIYIALLRFHHIKS